MEAHVAQLWSDYLKSKTSLEPCLKSKNKLIEHYYPLVKTVAQKMHQKNNQITVDEFISMGVTGLYDAIEGYNPEEYKNKFETYAMHRIRGSMLDEIRKMDWVPRLVRANFSWLDKIRASQESVAGRRLSNDELYDLIPDDIKQSKNIDSKQAFDNYVKSSTPMSMHSTCDAPVDNEETSMDISRIGDSRVAQPWEKLIRNEIFAKLMGKNFTPLEKKIVWLYYFDGFSMKEISDKVKLSESRVSQMHSNIKQRLESKVSRNPEYFSDIWEVVADFKNTGN